MKPHNKPTIRVILKKILSVVLPIFSTLFIVGTTALIIVVINGYSIDINKRVVIKTGVLNIETNPADADITVNGDYYGRSNKAIPNLEIGTYSVTLSKEGYFPFTKKVEIHHGLASPVIIPMLRTASKKEILKMLPNSIFDYNSTGYYVLSAGIEASDATQTPTPTKAKTKTDPTTTYTLSRIYVTKPLFDDPHPVLDEKMTITTLSASPITGISISPTGKLLFVTLTDKSGNKSVSLIPFKKNTTINANLTDTKSLTNYEKEKSTKLLWSTDGDYLVIETPTQLISYNVKAGTRVILVEKSELLTKTSNLIWNITDTGIVVIKKSQGTATNTYDIVDITYNGNPLSTQIPSITFENQPSNIWSYSKTDLPRFIIATKSGSFFLGKLFDAKSSEVDITLTSEKVGDLSIEHFNNDFSRIQISKEEIVSKPIHATDKELIAFTESKETQLVALSYNKRIADRLTNLGRKVILKSDSVLTAPSIIADDVYIATRQAGTLIAIDTTGENVLKVQPEIKTMSIGQNDLSLLFTDEKGTLWFRVLR